MARAGRDDQRVVGDRAVLDIDPPRRRIDAEDAPEIGLDGQRHAIRLLLMRANGALAISSPEDEDTPLPRPGDRAVMMRAVDEAVAAGARALVDPARFPRDGGATSPHEQARGLEFGSWHRLQVIVPL